MTVVKIKKENSEKMSYKKKSQIWILQELFGNNSAW